MQSLVLWRGEGASVGSSTPSSPAKSPAPTARESPSTELTPKQSHATASSSAQPLSALREETAATVGKVHEHDQAPPQQQQQEEEEEEVVVVVVEEEEDQTRSPLEPRRPRHVSVGDGSAARRSVGGSRPI